MGGGGGAVRAMGLRKGGEGGGSVVPPRQAPNGGEILPRQAQRHWNKTQKPGGGACPTLPAPRSGARGAPSPGGASGAKLLLQHSCARHARSGAGACRRPDGERGEGGARGRWPGRCPLALRTTPPPPSRPSCKRLTSRGRRLGRGAVPHGVSASWTPRSGPWGHPPRCKWKTGPRGGVASRFGANAARPGWWGPPPVGASPDAPRPGRRVRGPPLVSHGEGRGRWRGGAARCRLQPRAAPPTRASIAINWCARECARKMGPPQPHGPPPPSLAADTEPRPPRWPSPLPTSRRFRGRPTTTRGGEGEGAGGEGGGWGGPEGPPQGSALGTHPAIPLPCACA